MDSRERLARELCKMDGINPDAGADRSTGYTTPRWRFDLKRADAILASDWLRDTLAAERERCAKVVQKKAEAAHSRAFDLWEARERGYQVTTGELANARGRADWLEQLAQDIRNLEPEASDDRG